jgi:hypothetical protein
MLSTLNQGTNPGPVTQAVNTRHASSNHGRENLWAPQSVWRFLIWPPMQEKLSLTD